MQGKEGLMDENKINALLNDKSERTWTALMAQTPSTIKREECKPPELAVSISTTVLIAERQEKMIYCWS